MGEADYYLLIGGQEEGPWTLGQVEAFWQAAAVTLETLYAQPGMGEWKPLSTVLGSASSAAPQPASQRFAAATGPQPEDPYAEDQRKIIETVVNVMLPAVSVSAAPERGDMADKPVEPEEVDMAKMRRWLQDKLATIGLPSETETSAANERKFDDWLCQFSRDEQETIFGAINIHRLRKGNLTWQDLIGELEQLAASSSTTESSVEPFTPGNALWIIDIVQGLENRVLQAEQKASVAIDDSGYHRPSRQVNETPVLKSRASKISKEEREEHEAEFLAQTGVSVVKMSAQYQQAGDQTKNGKWVNAKGRFVSVEEIAAEWYQSRGYKAVRCEGIVISAWVGTFLREVIQDPHDPRVRQGFRTTTRDWTPHRKGAPLISILLPDDFGSAGYFVRRESAIRAALQRLQRAENLRALFDELLPVSEPLRDYLWVNRDEAVDSARTVLEVLTKDTVVSCIDWAIREFWQRRSGWPDLFVSSSSGYAFPEVKSPHDKLSRKQMKWFKWAIDEAHIPCELCRVEQE